MHDPDGPTPKPASTWGNTTGATLHNVDYGTPGRVQSAAATTIASPPGPDSVPAYPAGYPKTRNGPPGARLRHPPGNVGKAPVRPDSRPAVGLCKNAGGESPGTDWQGVLHKRRWP